MEIKDIINRLGIVRNKANLSARELSLRIGMSPQYISQIENRRISLSVEKLLDILEVCDCSLEKFFSDDFGGYDADIELLKIIKTIQSDKKNSLIDFLKK